MHSIKRARRVSYTAEQIYVLVNDIAAYKTFMPWCHQSDVLSDEKDMVVGRVGFTKAGLEKSFTTENKLTPPNRIDIQLRDGPFEQLEGHWLFQDQEHGGCLVVLELSFSFSSFVMEHLFGPIFHQVSNRLVDTFCDRAKEVYG